MRIPVDGMYVPALVRSFCVLGLMVCYLSELPAQCSCDDCPVPITSNFTTEAHIDISGAVNDQLGVNGQRLCRVCVHFLHDAPDEIDFFLISPSGSQVQLIENTGLSVNDNITFDICFLTCDQTAEPDPGFPAVFDSGAGWLPGQTYTGTYYPFDPACLESLTGAVNGTWTLEMTDVVSLDDGTLFDWHLVFEDDAGLGCPNAGECGETCLADAGTVPAAPDTFCVGDPQLMSSGFTPDYDGSTHIEPPAVDYGYTYVVAPAAAGSPVIEFSDSPDLTGYAPGTYLICGYSYLLADQSLIPVPDGMLTLDDLDIQITNGEICADKTDACFMRTIEPPPAIPDFTGPLDVCAGEPVQYNLANNDPLFDVSFQLTGSVSAYQVVNDVVNVTWLAGPASLCATFETACGAEQTCLDINISSPAMPMLAGELVVCPDDLEVYTVTPAPETGESYVFTVSNGTIISEGSDQFTVQWSSAASGQICAELISPVCPGVLVCEDIIINNADLLPTNITVPLEVCLGDDIAASIPFDAAILSYTWSATNLTITAGQGTNAVMFTGDAAGPGTLCVEITTECGLQGPLCEDITVTEVPAPTVDQVNPSCTPELALMANLSTGGTGIWTQESGPPGVIFATPSQPATQATFPEAGIYTLRFTETNGACSGFAEISVEILPDLVISPLTFDCTVDQEYTVTFEILSGQPPYTVNGMVLAGSIFSSGPIASGDPYVFDTEDALGCGVLLEGTYNCPCLSDAGTMPLEVLDVCASTGSAEAVTNGDVTLDGNDIGVYILHDSPGITLGNILDQNTTGIFTFGPGLNFGVTYYISFVVGNDAGGTVDLSDPCLDVAAGQPVIFYDVPTATLNGPPPSCDLLFDITGTLSSGVIDVSWSQIVGPSAATFSAPNDVPTTVTVETPGTYVFQLQLLNAACTAVEDISITILEEPEIILSEEICGVNPASYILTFEVAGGTPPYTANIPGAFDGSIFTSDPIPSGDSYAVIVTDVNGCTSAVLTGDKSCDCITSAGSMVMDLIEICDTLDLARGLENTPSILDGDDILAFYLHTSSTNKLGTIIDSNMTGEFRFRPGMETDVTYYISAVVGTDVNGFPSAADPCRDVAPGQPVVWYSPPVAMTGVVGSTCGDTITLMQAPPDGVWEIIDAPPGSNIFLLNLTDSTTTIAADSAGAYTLSWTGVNAVGCEDADTITVTNLHPPQIVNLATACSSDLMTYTVSFEIAGDAGPYSVNGESSGTSFVSGPLPVDSSVVFMVTSGSGCSVDVEAGPVDCSCVTDGGTISGEDRTLCADELLDVGIWNGDGVLDADDTIAYVLHDGTDMMLGNPLVISYGEPISFGASLAPNQIYILSVVAGRVGGGEIDLDDPCLSIAGSIQVQWEPLSSILSDAEITACIGDTAMAGVVFDGTYPVDLVLVNGQMDTLTLTLSGPADSLEFVVSGPSESWTLVDASGSCIREIGGTILLTGQAPADVLLASDGQVCNNSAFGTYIPLADLFVISPLPGTWSAPGLTIQGDTLFADGAGAGAYTLTFDTRGFEDPCPGGLFTTEIEVIDCTCPPVNLPDSLYTCSSADAIALENLAPPALTVAWTLDNFQNLPDPPVLVGDSIIVSGKSAGTFMVILELTDSFPEACQTTFALDLVVEGQRTAGTQALFPQICAQDTMRIMLFDLLSGADPGGQWTLDNDVIGPVVSPSDYDMDTLQFVYLVSETGVCPESSSEVEVIISPEPVFQVEVIPVSCAGGKNGALELDIEDQGDGPFTVYLNNVLQGQPFIRGLTAGDYNVRVENAVGCSALQAGIRLQEPEPLTVELGPDRTVRPGEQITIEAITNAGPAGVTAAWASDSGPITAEGLLLEYTVSQPETIAVTVQDSAGCVARDSLRLNLLAAEYYLPNVINPDSENPANRKFGLYAGAGIDNIDVFRIYDRWGELVYTADDVASGTANAFWDGTYNGETMLPGVYVYRIEFVVDGIKEILVGDVTLVR